MNQKTKAFIITTIIGIGILFFTYSRLDTSEIIISFKNFTFKVGAIYLAAVFLIEFFLVYRWQIILQAYNIKIPIHTLYLYKMSGYAVGYLSPQPHVGGEPVRAFLLKRNKISFTKGISTVLIDKSMQITTDLVFSLIGVILVLLHFSLSKEIQVFIIMAIFIPIILLIMFFDRMIRNKPFFSLIFNYGFLKKYKKQVLEIEQIIHTFYVKHVKAFFRVIIINIFLWLLMIVEYGSAMTMFGFKPNLILIFAVLAGVAISYSMPIPMALGVLEVSQVSALSFLNLNTVVGLSMSILVRIKDLIRSGIGVAALLYYGVSWTMIKDISKKAK